MLKPCIVFIVLIQISQHVLTKICDNKNENCCPDYEWNEALRSCTHCENGFYGINCETKCPFQYFGRKCLSKCNCTGKECHHVYGCESSTPGEITYRPVTTESSTDVSDTTKKFYQDSTTNFYEKYTSPVHLIKEDNRLEDMNPAMVGIIVLAMVSVMIMLLILCTYLWEKQQAVSRSHQESTPCV